MNGHMKTHGKHMLIGGAGIVVLMLALGTGWQSAVTWGLLLACPLGMMAMMWFMDREGSGGHQHGGQETADHGTNHGYRAEVPQQRVNEPFAPERRPGA